VAYLIAAVAVVLVTLPGRVSEVALTRSILDTALIALILVGDTACVWPISHSPVDPDDPDDDKIRGTR
jgi:hypothetical protein